MKAIRYIFRVLAIWQTWAAIVWAGAGTWLVMRQGQPFGLDYALRDAITDAAWEATRRLPKQLKGQRVAVCRLVGDDTGFVTCKLRSVLDGRDLYDLPPDGPYRNSLGKLKRKGRVEEPVVATFDEAVSAAHASKTPYALFGRVSDLSSADGRGRATLELSMVDSLNRLPVGETVTIRSPEDIADKFSDDLTSFFWRSMVWVGFVILLPVISSPLVRRALFHSPPADKPAGLSLAASSLAAAYALLAWGLALLLSRLEIPAWPMAALLMGCVLAAMLSNVYAFKQIERAQKLREQEGDDRVDPGVYVSEER